MTKILVNLTCFFGCAFLGAAMVLFTGWPLALVAAALCFLATQHVLAGFARRADKRASTLVPMGRGSALCWWQFSA